MAHRELNCSDEVREYEFYLDEGWPERRDVAAHIAERLAYLDLADPRILELGCGPGALATVVLELTPGTVYTGVDIAMASLDYARERLKTQHAHAHWVQADLNETGWLSEVGGDFDAVVSMQSIHDLGGEQEVTRIFGIANRLLAPDGLFIYADLLRSQSDPDGSNPGRFFVQRHVELLEAAGFADAHCTMLIGGFGCFEAADDGEGATGN